MAKKPAENKNKNYFISTEVLSFLLAAPPKEGGGEVVALDCSHQEGRTDHIFLGF